MNNFLNKLEQLLKKLTEKIDERKKDVELLENKFLNVQKTLDDFNKRFLIIHKGLKEFDKSLNFWTSLNLEEKQKLLENLSTRLEALEKYMKIFVEEKINKIDKNIKEKNDELENKIKKLIDKIKDQLKYMEFKVEKEIFVPVGSGSQPIKIATFILANGTPATVGTNKTNELIIVQRARIIKAYAYAKTAPQGADLIFDINSNNVSLWKDSPDYRLKINNGENFGFQTYFDIIEIRENDRLTIDIDQIGSSVAGQDITVELKLNLI